MARKSMKDKIQNIGMIGCGFMGRVHSNAYNQVEHFFDAEYKPVMKAVCDSNEVKLKAFAELLE
jgi:predicted dehydrogenase